MSHQTGYKQGYSASTVSNHAVRTVDTDAAFVLPHIKPADKILDVGCGPGSITVGFARYATRGSVVGVDLSNAVLDMARARCVSESPTAGGGAISFVKADVVGGAAGLPFPDDEFDVVFVSQLFPHLQRG